MLWGIAILIGIALLVLYSLGKGLDIADEAWKNRKPKELCPYCGSALHHKSYHVPKP